MIDPDVINCLFELSAATILSFNVWATYKAKGTIGVSVGHPVFFSSLAAWHIYFYFSLSQWFSVAGTLISATINTTWLVQILYYNFYHKGRLMGMDLTTFDKALAEEVEVNNQMPAAFRQSQQALERRAGVKVFNSHWRLAVHKQGTHDIEVEVYRNGTLQRVQLTNVRKGEAFQTLNDEGGVKQAFLCKEPARNVGGDPKNPSFMLGVVECKQADQSNQLTLLPQNQQPKLIN